MAIRAETNRQQIEGQRRKEKGLDNVKEQAMVPNNRIQRFLSIPSNRPAENLRRRGSESLAIGDGLLGPERPDRAPDFLQAPGGMNRPLFDRPPSVEDLRVHAALFERLAALRRTRRSFWSKIWGFIRGD
jgi:hypothetical protein